MPRLHTRFLLPLAVALAIGLGSGLPLAAAPSQPPKAAQPPGAAAAVEAFHDALAAGDSARAISLLADDALILESGAVQTRAEYLSHHLAADMKASKDSKAVRTVIRTTAAGDVAYVVSRTITPPTNAEGSTGSELAELMVLSRVGSDWRIRAVHWSSRRRRA